MKSANVVHLMEQSEPSVQNGRVLSVSENGIMIRVNGQEQSARPAFSCLVKPEPGDLVLCARNENGVNYILCITERPGEQHMTLSFPADADLAARQGSIRMVSAQSLQLAAGENLNCFSDREIHKSREAVMDFEEVTARGNNLQASFQSVRLISQVIQTFAKQLMEKVKNYMRHTENYDQVQAGQMTRKTEGLYSLDSRHTVMVSKKDTKIDGERIHMG